MKQVIIGSLLLLFPFLLGAQSNTYKIGNTEYYLGQYYSTTGKPMVKRSEANKKAFLRSMGMDEVPYGFEVDHIKPLSEGGLDEPFNMQLLTIPEHNRKTAAERSRRSNSTYSGYSGYSSSSTYTPSSTFRPSTSTGTGRVIQTGPRGGQYYINGSGNKVYVKKN